MEKQNTKTKKGAPKQPPKYELGRRVDVYVELSIINTWDALIVSEKILQAFTNTNFFS
jgi:hypothetical protein